MSIIEIENLSKKFLIAHQGNSLIQSSIKEELTYWTKKIVNSFSSSKASPPKETFEEFWALSNINLNIQEGDKVALLGRNGAGKSTLLKIISRILEPTQGRLKIRGRVSSVLEVGAGFHPELTGRENIFLNGAVMGMNYAEIKRKFDEIVSFAEVEKFLDTPIKRYSSGMTTRLGFAIAASLDSDLLIVDEALAVGDYKFQEKCLNKMNEIGSRGNTVLFVSHNVNAVLSLCTKGIFLEKGKVVSFEPISECVNRYMRSCPHIGLEWQGEAGNDQIRFFTAKFNNCATSNGLFSSSQIAQLQIQFELCKPETSLNLGISILNSKQNVIARSRISDHEVHRRVMTQSGQHTLCYELDLNLLHPGEYFVRVDCLQGTHKKILDDEVLLRFGISSEKSPTLIDELDGISLGNRWLLPS